VPSTFELRHPSQIFNLEEIKSNKQNIAFVETTGYSNSIFGLA